MGVRAPAGQLEEVAPVVLGAGDHEARQGDLLPQLCGVRGIDVLGVGREAEGQPAQDRGIQGHRCRRVGEMGVQVDDSASGQAPGDQVARLQKMPQGGRMARAQVAATGKPQAGCVAPGVPDSEAQVGKKQPVDVSQERLRQVVHPGAYLGDARVGEALSARTHGKDVHGEAQLLQQQDLVGDEGLRDPGIALQDHPQHRPCRGCHGLWPRNSRMRCFMVSMPVNRKSAIASW